MLSLDYKIFQYFNGWAGKSAYLDAVVIFIAHWLVYVLAVVLIALWFFNRDKLRTRMALVSAFASFFVARLIIVEFIRAIIPRARPFLAHSAVQLIAKGNESSFPSGHAAALFAIATAIYFYNKKAGVLLCIVAILVSIARVIAGVHYPSDIIAGAIVGIGTAWIFKIFFKEKFDAPTEKLSELSDKLLPFTKR